MSFDLPFDLPFETIHNVLIWSLDILQHKVEKDLYEKGKEIMIFPDIYINQF